MVQSTMIVAINRPIAQVFAFVANAETAPQWQADPIDRVFSAATGTTWYTTCIECAHG